MIYKVVLLLILTLTSCFIIPKLVFAENFQYPLEKTLERSSYKSFGQYFDKNFYIGKENLFPNQFIGYHVGTDLEIFPQEKDTDVPVFAVGNGIISFMGPVTGYGGLILEKFDDMDLTALYGHLKLSSTNIKVGDRVNTDQTLALLGDEYSSETAGERKHLHFAIYHGQDLYFKGYENTKDELDQKWIDPMRFLETRISSINPSITPTLTTTSIFQNNNIFNTVWNWIKKILNLSN